MADEKKSKKTKSKSKEKSKKSSRKTKKSSDDLKKPATPYFLFCSKCREDLKKSGDDRKLTAKELGAMWKKLPETEKKIYNDLYQESKKKYEKLKNELESESNEESDVEDDKETKIKTTKVKAKIKKNHIDKNNAKACNCGKCTDCKKRRAKVKKSEDENDEKKTILFQQPSESTPAKHILVHLPKKEIFMSTLHPAASLYEDVTDEVKIEKCFKNLEKILKDKDIEIISVRSALKLNKASLKALASESLKYEIDENSKIEKNSPNYEKFQHLLDDSYKNEVLEKLSDDQLVDVVLNKPTYKLRPTNLNTFIEPTIISFDPLGALIFCRDQQITTTKGIVIGRSKASQRAGEHKIMKQVFENLNSNVLGILTKEYDEDAYLEGGDYFVAKEDLSMLGVGLRTSIKGAEYLMQNDFLGTRYLAIIYDNEDLDQQRMHLDTYFNILNDKYVIVLDFDEVQTHYKDKKINRKVYLYDNQATEKINSDNEKMPNSVAKYKLIKIYEKFYEFLEENDYELIKVTHQQQIDYMINFLNIGNNNVISVNKELKKIAKKTGVNIIYIDFKPITNMYGAMHCITQVSRVD